MTDVEIRALVADIETRLKTLEEASQKKLDDIQMATARMAYSEYGSQIRHFSTVRSALTTFLVTAGMTALAGYIDKQYPFLYWAGLIFAAAAVIVCGWFSMLTEKHVLLYKGAWNQIKGAAPGGETTFGRMAIDPMNWLLILAAAGFMWFAATHYPQPPAGRSVVLPANSTSH